MDVVGPTTCDISIDKSRELLQGIEQEMLETALPKRGGPVLILFGKHKGVYGTLMERDMEKETGVVQDADSHALFKVRLEQIAKRVTHFEATAATKVRSPHIFQREELNPSTL